jgi:hypothetical protein
MELYKPYEIKIITNRSKEEVIMRLSKNASFSEDQFKIHSSVFSFRRGSKMKGKVFTNDNLTVVEATVLPSNELKLFPFLILLLSIIAFFVVAMSQLKQHKFDPKIFFFFPGFFLLSGLIYGITRINFWLSAQAQESFLKNIVK